ncbi:hypothetical protein Bca52824_079562 [Brassica carinata]|uniref:Uncharacterized protein n=1 Tax=Brassica carinata TaxID=52824 RepID=A0A8X7Q1F7_BRACI|nr:hypothetical protein Bca52824_079562 [Brassica carinata]
MLPHIDLTHQLLLRRATVTILVTPKSSPYLDPLRSLHSREHFKTLILPFPSHPSIPSGVETLQQLPLQALPHMLEALSGLHDPLVDFQNHQQPSDLPDVILGSSFLSPWINKVADAFSLKSIYFLPINAHAISTMWGQEDRGFFDELETATTASYGLVVNTFHELEPELVESVTARFMTHHRVWTVGPLLAVKAGVDRGGSSSSRQRKSWLDPTHGGANGGSCGGLGDKRCAFHMGHSVPDSGKLARVLADSVKDDFPERVRLMKLREKGMEAIQEGGSSYNNLDELVAEMCV